MFSEELFLRTSCRHSNFVNFEVLMVLFLLPLVDTVDTIFFKNSRICCAISSECKTLTILSYFCDRGLLAEKNLN